MCSGRSRDQIAHELVVRGVYTYVGNNPLNATDPSGTTCVAPRDTVNCTPTDNNDKPIPGLPSISFPKPQNWPSTMSAAGNPVKHHAYTYRTPIGNKSPASVQKSVANDPTPNNSDKPASAQGTPNDATPSEGVRGVAASLVNNDVKSYTATDANGNTWVINVTEPSHTLSPGYVLRGTVGNDLVSYGEGLALKQALGPLSDVSISDAWINQNQRNVDEAR